MDHKVYEDRFLPDAETAQRWADFVAVVRQLRRDCPWDREQTHESVRHLLIEETYEVLDAIDAGLPEELAHELGDLLLHVVFHAVMAEEADTFRLKDVIVAITEKLIRRHPHVFGEAAVSGVDEVLENWEQIKLKEGGRASLLDGVPRPLPALLRAFRMQEKAAGVGFDFAEPEAAWVKVEEELREFQAVKPGDVKRREEELGDVLFAVVNYARLAGMNPENALRAANDKFQDRFRHIEHRLTERGRSVAEANLEEMEALWVEAKQREASE